MNVQSFTGIPRLLMAYFVTIESMPKVTGTIMPRITGIQTPIVASPFVDAVDSSIKTFDSPSKTAQTSIRTIPTKCLHLILQPYKTYSKIPVKKGDRAHKQEIMPILMCASLDVPKFKMIMISMNMCRIPSKKTVKMLPRFSSLVTGSLKLHIVEPLLRMKHWQVKKIEVGTRIPMEKQKMPASLRAPISP